MNPAAPSQALQEWVTSYVETRTGLSFAGSQGNRLRQAVAKTLPAPSRKAPFPAELTEEVFAQLCEALTVQESYFFREPAKLALIKDYVLPGVRNRRGPLRVWSAGCAAGEEAYTLAALLTEEGLAGRYRILGTDLSEAAVAAARRGSYTKWSVRGLGEERLSEIFERKGARHDVVDRYRERVGFAQHNLLDARPKGWGEFDLVLCRNVLIYFTPEAARAVIENLTASLVPGGWLVLGVSDPLAIEIPGVETVVTEYGLAYRRHDPQSRADPEQVVEPAVEPAPRAAAAHPRRGQRRVARPSTAPTRRIAGRDPVPAGKDSRRALRGEGTSDLQNLLDAADRSLKLAQPGDAERSARRALTASPHDRAAHLLLVQALAEQGRGRDAITCAEGAVALFPDDVEVRHLQAVVLLERGDAAAAVGAARQAVYLEPGFAPAHLVLGRAQELLGDASAARRSRRNGQRLLAEGAGE